MTRPLAARMSRLGTETAFEVLAKARALEAQGRDIIHLEIGEPDFDTPPSIVHAGLSALQRGETHYNPSAGVIELREAIAAHLNKTRHLNVDPGQVIVTPGAKPIMFFAMLALLDAGDEAIYPDPGFPIYASMIQFAGAKGVPLKLREKDDFNPDLDELKSLVNERTRLIVLNSPHNPTGGVLSQSVLREIAHIARARDLWVLADEIYGEILYEGSHHSILREDGMEDRTILLDGFSKTFAMTGWRLGYGVFPRRRGGALCGALLRERAADPARGGEAHRRVGPRRAAGPHRRGQRHHDGLATDAVDHQVDDVRRELLRAAPAGPRVPRGPGIDQVEERLCRERRVDRPQLT